MAEELPQSSAPQPNKRDADLWEDYLVRDAIKGLDPASQAIVLARLKDIARPAHRPAGTGKNDEAALMAVRALTLGGISQSKALTQVAEGRWTRDEGANPQAYRRRLAERLRASKLPDN